MHQIVKITSTYQELTVYEANQMDGKLGKYRFLQFSADAIQGALNVRCPERIVLEYPRAIIHLLDYNRPFFAKAFMIGHGIGTIARNYEEKRFIVAELDEQVAALSKAYFHYRHNNVVIGDGRERLTQEADGQFDFVVVDAFTSAGTPLHLVTKEFFRMSAQKLAPGGAIILNLFGRSAHDPLIAAIYTTLLAAFPFAKAFALPAEGRRNMLLMASTASIGYEAAAMAGFREIELEQGYCISDQAGGGV
ncbi:spermidine synthase [Paenibacillus sp. GCM10027626]|uniref:spermidine synthase n=1 Tax=Paenibacillus sp. GCM10027626 TaxID=3273411 RepID=UPI003624FE87